MGRTRGSKNKRTLALYELVRSLAPTTLCKVAEALGRSEDAAYAFLHHHGMLAAIGRGGRSKAHYHALATQGGSERLPIPADIDEDTLRRGLIAGIEPGRIAWLLSCPRGGNAHGWRGGSAIG